MTKHELTLYARTSALYHRRRQGFFETADSLSKAASLILSSGAGVALIQRNGNADLAIWLAFGVSAVTLLALVFGTSRKATTHSTLARRWLELESRISMANDEASALREYEAEIPKIEQDEPPPLGALIRLCQREVMRATGEREEALPQVSLFHRLFAHWWDFQTPSAECAK